ncbi:glycoside hydrolase family 28 protein [Robbsia andropogonis]|uniref:glycoside hydrolase family 28 protein n=1 Tax=Robbsia andropogonis TaxID=28092 RepID=UPI000467DD02|nr:glycosyl hydrolase family 28 protein [Robbsia andropogonis]MCP1120883.1 glycoside hydrolase family 28 protein [Robbsia andropogonis]MCP1130655.1 glycoside hydrolase family 28 protein [Robbsia andropogonis]
MSVMRSPLMAGLASLFLFSVPFVRSLHAQDRRTVLEPMFPSHVCAALTAGPAGEPKDDTSRLQSAIDNCPDGDAVRLLADAKGNRFFSRPLTMKSGVTLWLDRGVVLTASSDPRNYDRDGRCGTIDARGDGCRPFILFDRTRGGGIVGDGTIDGQGGVPLTGQVETWWQLARRAQREGGKQNAPRLIQVDHARDITFYRVTLRNAANFHVAMNDVKGATFWGIRIDTPANARNTDGIDPGASEDITIAHDFIRTGDDNVAIKAGRGGATRHVSLLDNHFYWGHGMSIGSETVGGVSSILIRDLTLDGTTSGLRIKSDGSRGGQVSDVLYEHVCMRDNRRPIDFDTRYDVRAQGGAIPVYRDIVLHDVIGDAGTLVMRGYDAAHPMSVMLDGVHFASDARWEIANAQLSIGAGGVWPPPSGGASMLDERDHARCDDRWVAFPSSQ